MAPSDEVQRGELSAAARYARDLRAAAAQRRRCGAERPRSTKTGGSSWPSENEASWLRVNLRSFGMRPYFRPEGRHRFLARILRREDLGLPLPACSVVCAISTTPLPLHPRLAIATGSSPALRRSSASQISAPCRISHRSRPVVADRQRTSPPSCRSVGTSEMPGPEMPGPAACRSEAAGERRDRSSSRPAGASQGRLLGGAVRGQRPRGLTLRYADWDGDGRAALPETAVNSRLLAGMPVEGGGRVSRRTG